MSGPVLGKVVVVLSVPARGSTDRRAAVSHEVGVRRSDDYRPPASDRLPSSASA